MPYLPPQKPAKMFPKKLVKNQVPIHSDKNCRGASFDTNDSPIGDKHNSDNVIIKYTRINHSGETFAVSEKFPANAIIT